MRHLTLPRPPSRAAIWSARLAFFGVLVAALALLLAKSSVIEPLMALVVLASGGLVELVALLTGTIAIVIIWRTGRGGTGMAMLGIFLSLLLLAFPAFLAVRSFSLPMLNDVTTDSADPPQYSTSARALAARGGRTPGTIPAATRLAQQKAYPGVQTKVIDVEADEAFHLLLKTIAARGWRIVEQSLPGGRGGIGHIDAIDRTPLLGFSDDVTIRLRPMPGQTRVDIRSASRVGDTDFGTNAKRIEGFMRDLQAQVEAR